jgi:hypothetical protein
LITFVSAEDVPFPRIAQTWGSNLDPVFTVNGSVHGESHVVTWNDDGTLTGTPLG